MLAERQCCSSLFILCICAKDFKRFAGSANVQPFFSFTYERYHIYSGSPCIYCAEGSKVRSTLLASDVQPFLPLYLQALPYLLLFISFYIMSRALIQLYLLAADIQTLPALLTHCGTFSLFFFTSYICAKDLSSKFFVSVIIISS